MQRLIRGRDRSAVIVGGGHNGLVAANLLADAGWNVVVLEAAERAGGAVRSDQSMHDGFVTDWFSAFYPLGAASPILQRLDLQRWGLSWRHAPAVLSHLLPDGRCAVLSRSAERTAASLESFAPGDGDAWLRLTEQFHAIREPLIDALMNPFPPVRAATGLLRGLGIADALRFARFAVSPVRRFAEETFDGEGARVLLAGNALHSDLSPGSAGSAVYGWLLCMLGQTVGFPVPSGGAGALVDALCARLQHVGGTLRLNSPVAAIDVANGRVRGVRLDSGELIAADSVLADVDAPQLYLRLLDREHLPERLIADVERFQWDVSTVKLNWALSQPIPWTTPDASLGGTVHLGVDVEGLNRYATALASRAVPEAPFIVLGQMTTSDPSRSPQGTESAWAYTHVPRNPGLDQADIDRHVDRVESVIEAQAPGFRSSILQRQVQTPRDLEQADRNLSCGAIAGGTSAMHQQLFFRPIPGLGRAETVIDGLYLASASAHPGGGVHGAPGSNAARAALRRAGHVGRLHRAAVNAAHRRIYSA